LRLRSFLSRQSTPGQLGWILKACGICCAAGLILSVWGVSKAYKSQGTTERALADEKAAAARLEDELAKKAASLFRALPRDAALGQDQYLASFIEELGLLADESECTVISVQSGTVATQAAPTPTPGMEAGTPQGGAQAAQEAAQAANRAAEAARAAEQGGMPAGDAQPPPLPGTSVADSGSQQTATGSAWEEIRLEASLRGGFSGTLRLLDALCHSGKVCAVRDFDISRSTVDHATGQVKVQMKLQISIFRKA
jgi:hypothetical protein